MKHFLKTIFFVFIILLGFFLLKNFEVPKSQSIENPVTKQIQEVKLIRVVDGDTLLLNINGKKERVRLVGMDAPESVKPNTPVECFGKEASEHLKDLVQGKKLVFLSDPSQDSRDRFHRLLGYVFADQENLAEKMIYDGYAYEYTYNRSYPYQYQSIFRKAEREARENERGLWAPHACEN